MHWLEHQRTESNSFRIRRAAACLAVVTALFLLTQTAALAASDTERRLQDIEKEIEASRDRQESLEKQDTSLEREITAMRAAMIAAAKGAQQHAHTRQERVCQGGNRLANAIRGRYDFAIVISTKLDPTLRDFHSKSCSSSSTTT